MTARRRSSGARASTSGTRGTRRAADDDSTREREARVWAAFVAAARLTAATWQTAEYSVINAEDLERASSLLVAAVDSVRASRPVDVSALPAFVPSARLLERIRRTFCRSVDALDPGAVMTVIRAVDDVLAVLEEDAAQRFTGRLASFDAQQLIVEMAHDMRSPLGSILLLAERLRSGVGGADLPAAHQRQLGLIYSAAFGLSSLASDVIELARGGATLIDTEPVPFSVSDVLQSNADILRPMAEEKRLTMEWRGPTADARIGHPAALNRVLLNLATNAIKFTNAGSVRVAATELDRVRIEFAVQDTGRGIPTRVMAHLFEAFRQRQMPGDYAFSSAGLGLSICQKLVRAMGGVLQVETELERGTRFSFTLSLPQATRLS